MQKIEEFDIMISRARPILLMCYGYQSVAYGVAKANGKQIENYVHLFDNGTVKNSRLAKYHVFK